MMSLKRFIAYTLLVALCGAIAERELNRSLLSIPGIIAIIVLMLAGLIAGDGIRRIS